MSARHIRNIPDGSRPYVGGFSLNRDETYEIPDCVYNCDDMFDVTIRQYVVQIIKK